MLVFWQQRLALLATPKTGTTAIEAALESLAAVVIQRPPQLKHTSVHRFHRFIGPYLETSAGEPFTVVALMREQVAALAVKGAEQILRKEVNAGVHADLLNRLKTEL